MVDPSQMAGGGAPGGMPGMPPGGAPPGAGGDPAALLKKLFRSKSKRKRGKKK